jgi:hypothetical protein
MIKKGSWVQIHKVVLKPEERTAQIPEETKKVPLEMWVKGFLCEDSLMNDFVEITTLTGRTESGTLIAVNPSYHHDYGDFVPELLQIDKLVKTALQEVKNE